MSTIRIVLAAAIFGILMALLISSNLFKPAPRQAQKAPEIATVDIPAAPAAPVAQAPTACPLPPEPPRELTPSPPLRLLKPQPKRKLDTELHGKVGNQVTRSMTCPGFVITFDGNRLSSVKTDLTETDYPVTKVESHPAGVTVHGLTKYGHGRVDASFAAKRVTWIGDKSTVISNCNGGKP